VAPRMWTRNRPSAHGLHVDGIALPLRGRRIDLGVVLHDAHGAEAHDLEHARELAAVVNRPMLAALMRHVLDVVDQRLGARHVVRQLLADQIAAIRDPSHERRVTESNGVTSLEMAVDATRCAGGGEM